MSWGLQNEVVRNLPPDAIDIYLLPFLSPHRRGIASFYPGQIISATDYFAQLEAGLPGLADQRHSSSGPSKDRDLLAAILFGGKNRPEPEDDRVPQREPFLFRG